MYTKKKTSPWSIDRDLDGPYRLLKRRKTRRSRGSRALSSGHLPGRYREPSGTWPKKWWSRSGWWGPSNTEILNRWCFAESVWTRRCWTSFSSSETVRAGGLKRSNRGEKDECGPFELEVIVPAAVAPGAPVMGRHSSACSALTGWGRRLHFIRAAGRVSAP